MIFVSGNSKGYECPFRVMALMSAARGQQNCVGHRCPMWRWKNPDVNTPQDDREGFCGLAGKPHEWTPEELETEEWLKHLERSKIGHR